MARQAVRKEAVRQVQETKKQAEIRELWSQVSKLMEKIMELEGSNDNSETTNGS